MFKKATSSTKRVPASAPVANQLYNAPPPVNPAHNTSRGGGTYSQYPQQPPPAYNAPVNIAPVSRFSQPIANPSKFSGAGAKMSAVQKYGIPPDRLAVLKGYDVIFLIDDSWSMNGEQGSRIMQVRETITMFAEVACEYDDDGVDVCFLNNVHIQETVTDPARIQDIMGRVKWDGSTPIGRRLSEILNVYYGLLQHNPQSKPISIVIITDGAPSDKALVESTIVDCAKRMAQRNTPNQVAFQFFQVGNDNVAKNYLEYLDDNLEKKYRINDIVDCVHCEKGGLTLQERFIKALVGGIDGSVDNVSGYQ